MYACRLCQRLPSRPFTSLRAGSQGHDQARRRPSVPKGVDTAATIDTMISPIGRSTRSPAL